MHRLISRLKKKIDIVTLGCSKNTVDTEHLIAQLPSDSWAVVDDASAADVVLINTCGFIGDAKQESIDTILEAVEIKKQHPGQMLGVFGCLSQRYSKEMPELIPEVDAWFGARSLDPVLKWLGVRPDPEAYKNRVPTDGRPGVAYLKISEGCDRRCSYCAIPFIRGKHVSVPVEDIVAEARLLAAKGVKELVLIAQDTTYYGLDLYGRRALADVLRALSAIDGIGWIRIHYSYPDGFPEDVLDEMASNPKVCSYLDIPLQHISDKVLANMRRHVDSAWTRELIGKMRSKVPGVALRTTMIVGHPGEGEKEFQELLDFVREARFQRLGAFMYSEEEGTYGARHFADDVPQEEKQRRLDALMSLQADISLEFNRSRIGTVEKVLVDAVNPDGTLVCRSRWESPDVDGEIIVDVPEGFDSEAAPGSFIQVKITQADLYDLRATLL